MKAFTIYQPWASLLACGAMTYETHTWPTYYRGLVAIHAAEKEPQWFYDVLPVEIKSAILEVLYPLYASWDDVPCGSIIATAELVECRLIVRGTRTGIDREGRISLGTELIAPEGSKMKKRRLRPGEYAAAPECEKVFGDWTPGRYAYKYNNIRMLPNPIPAKGDRGFWDWEC